MEKTSKKIESIAEGLVRGLQLLHVEVSDKERTYTIVLGWDAKTAAATKQVKASNDSDTNQDSSPDSDSGKPGKPKKGSDKKIEDRKVTSPDAKKFLP